QPAVPAFTHRPVAGTQLSTVQVSLSLQSTGAVGCWQTPLPSHVRTPLQRSPSSQFAPGRGTLLHTPPLHARFVQGLPSSGQSVGSVHWAGATQDSVTGLQTMGAAHGSGPDMHSPLWHCS